VSVLNIAFRTDATSQIGTGHFMRCLTLADALKRQGATMRFVSRNLPAHLGEMLKAKGMDFVALPNEIAGELGGDLAHSQWLGASQVQDAHATGLALSDKQWDWIIVDHYALDARWESALRAVTKQIMVIDDLADRKHDCDVLLDQNYYRDMQTRYDGKVPEHCRMLFGPRYALLREEFRELRAQVKPRTGEVRRILLFFGGVDAGNHTGLAIKALSGLDIKGVKVVVVIGAQHPHRTEIEQACVAQGYVCHVQTARMAELMAEADLAIGAGGSATWERCCLGLPALLVALADNQINIAKALDLFGAAIYVGTLKTASVTFMRSAIVSLISTQDQLKVLSKKAYSLVDGLGVSRVCQEMSC
jgi:UDP-2,4-diacetamido-2,4,6-trideoxy-beta-L-altropyranose hydrolase